MIKSGLVNQRLGGGFEKGYPNQFNQQRLEIERPVVFTQDKTVLEPSPANMKAFTPSPVMYNDLFGKTLSPDERVYILRQAQQGEDQVQKTFVKLRKGLPDRPMDPIQTPIVEDEKEAPVEVLPPQPIASPEDQEKAEEEWVNYGLRDFARDTAAGTLGFIAGDVPGIFAGIETARALDRATQTYFSSTTEKLVKSNGVGPRMRNMTAEA